MEKRKLVFIIVLVILLSIILDCMTGFRIFLDYLSDRKTISNINSNNQIIQDIKEHFDIDYEIEKVTFWTGIPDGYYLQVYNKENMVKEYFEDNHEDSDIYDYFRNIKPDKSKYSSLLPIEFSFEIIIIIFICSKIKKKD